MVAGEHNESRICSPLVSSSVTSSWISFRDTRSVLLYAICFFVSCFHSMVVPWNSEISHLESVPSLASCHLKIPREANETPVCCGEGDPGRSLPRSLSTHFNPRCSWVDGLWRWHQVATKARPARPRRGRLDFVPSAVLALGNRLWATNKQEKIPATLPVATT